MNVLDKVIAAVSPQTAVKRAVARVQLEFIDSGYGNYGASHSRNSMRGWNWLGGSADEDIHDNLDVLRQRSRDLYSGVPMASAALKTMRTNVVGQGLRLKSQIDFKYLGISEEQAREIESVIEREFALWADTPDCDAERIDNFYELQQLAFLNWLMSGDVLALMPVKKRAGNPYELTVQLIEADRISTPDNEKFNENIVSGVERDKTGEVVAYWISKKHPLASDCSFKNEWKRIKAYGDKTGRRNALFICCRERIGQYRGVPFIAPVIEALKQIGRYTDAELMAAVISGMFTVFIEKDGVSEAPPFGEDDEQDTPAERTGAGTVRLGNGAIIDLQDGEKAHDINPGRPNANFNGFVEAILSQIGAALEIPYEVLTKHFSSNYSAARGALLEAWKTFKMYRSWLANDFCQPIFEEWFCEAVAKGRISAPGFFSDPQIRRAYCRAKWNGPTQGQIDPLKEVNAAVVRVQNGFSTRDTESMELNGSTFGANVSQLKTENKLLNEAGEFPAGDNSGEESEENSDEE